MVSYYHTPLSRVHTCSSRFSSTSIWITCLPPGGLIIPCIILSHRFVQPIPTCWSYTYNALPGNAYANQNGVPSLATFNPYDMASYGGGKVIKYHHQPKNITLKIMLASSFCPRSDHQLRWHPDRHLTRNHIPCPQTHLVDGQQQKFNMHLWSCTSSKMSLYMLRAEAKTNFWRGSDDLSVSMRQMFIIKVNPTVRKSKISPPSTNLIVSVCDQIFCRFKQ